jgi:serine/threonine-protein phosphatase 5
MHIFEVNGNPSESNPYLFNGDVVDRGSFSLECILTLFIWKIASPKSMYISRGNHEAKSMNKMYGFEGEVTKKLSVKFYHFFSDLF